VHHHQLRNKEVFDILGRGKDQHAYLVASRMNWDLSYKSWDEFPVVQKWFATGEALAHLRFLEREGKVCRQTGDGIERYSLA
jgi:hypothetical protein